VDDLVNFIFVLVSYFYSGLFQHPAEPFPTSHSQPPNILLPGWLTKIVKSGATMKNRKKKNPLNPCVTFISSFGIVGRILRSRKRIPCHQ
jgi:hypothetical protein